MNRYIFGLIFFLPPSLLGFVFISSSGPAKITSDRAEPNVTFYWNQSTPSFKDSPENGISETEQMASLIQEAMDLWNNIPGSFVKLVLEERLDATKNPEDHIHTITVENSSNATTSASALPKTENEKIVDCDILVTNRSISKDSLRFTLAHELGHCLGLGHAHTNPHSIMSYANTSRKLKLAADDVAGTLYLYPDTDSPQDPDHLPRCGASTPQGYLSPFWLLLFLGITRKRITAYKQKRKS